MRKREEKRKRMRKGGNKIREKGKKQSLAI